MTIEPQRPNVLVFFTDQQRWDTVGLHGNPFDVTPNFDRLATEGRFVPNSFTCQPVCGPARSALQTGKYPTTTGCFTNGIALPEQERTLADFFGAASYHTGYIGKWHLADEDPVPAHQQGGYDSWLASNLLEFTSWPYDTVLYEGDGTKCQLPGYRVDALADAAIRFVSQPRSEPFFLFLSFLEPHHQNQHDNYPAPVGYAERLRDRSLTYPPDLGTLGGTTEAHYHGYMGMVARLDEALGRVVDALRSLRCLENTIILFTSDHGCHFKTRNDEYKRSCHEASIRVPTFLRGPGFRGGEVSTNCSTVDLTATLLEAADIEVPADLQGSSLLSDRDHDDDIFVQISESQVGRALRSGNWKYCVTAPDAHPMLDAASDRYVETHLYDLETDPWELNDLVESPDHVSVRSELSAKLTRRVLEVEAIETTIVPRHITESA